MNITIEQKQFFSLLRAGLWGEKADASLFGEETKWMSLLIIAKKQALLGIVFDGIQTLPENLRPNRGVYLQWCNLVAQIEQENHHLNAELKNVFSLYRENNITPVLLKGQGVAQNYPHPYHRQCGDIDVYTGDGYSLANTLLRKDGTDHLEETNKHTNILWHGVDIENHRIIAHLSEPRANRFFQKAVAQWFPKEGCEVEIDGYKVMTPPVDFNIVFILMHSTLHFLNEGIGLRQVCDWTCLLHAQQQKMDPHTVTQFLKRVGLYRAAKAFGAIAISQLGLPENELPFLLDEPDRKRGRWLLEHILQSGNFGQHDSQTQKRPKGYWSGKWHTFCRVWSHSYKFRELAPAEACWHPFMLAWASAKMQIKKKRA